MNWSKIKSILIGILLITNAILLFQLLTKTTFERSNSIEDVLKLYEAKGIGVEVRFGHGPQPRKEGEPAGLHNIAYIHAGNAEDSDAEGAGGVFVTATSETSGNDGNPIAVTRIIPAQVFEYVDLDAIPEKLYGYSAVRHVFSDAHVAGIADELNKLEGEFTIDMDAQSLNVYYTGAFDSEMDVSFEGGQIYQMSENERAAFAAEAINMLKIIGLGGLEILDIQAAKYYDIDWSKSAGVTTQPQGTTQSQATTRSQGTSQPQGTTQPQATTQPQGTTQSQATTQAQATTQGAVGSSRHTYTVCRLYKSLQPDGGIDSESEIFVVFRSEGQLLGIFVQDLMAIVGASERPYDIIPVHEALFKALDRVEHGDVLKRFRIVFKLNDESIPADDIVRGEMLPYYELCFVKAGKVHIRATK